MLKNRSKISRKKELAPYSKLNLSLLGYKSLLGTEFKRKNDIIINHLVSSHLSLQTSEIALSLSSLCPVSSQEGTLNPWFAADA